MSQKNDDDLFCSREGECDLYSTMVGWLFCHELGVTTYTKVREQFIDSQDSISESFSQSQIETLELCRRLHWIMRYGNSLGQLMGPEMDCQSIMSELASNGGDTLSLAIRMCLEGLDTKYDKYMSSEQLERLVALQSEEGGFVEGGSDSSQELLASVWALYALKLYGIKPQYGSREYFEQFFAYDMEDFDSIPALYTESGNLPTVFYALTGLGLC